MRKQISCDNNLPKEISRSLTLFCCLLTYSYNFGENIMFSAPSGQRSLQGSGNKAHFSQGNLGLSELSLLVKLGHKVKTKAWTYRCCSHTAFSYSCGYWVTWWVWITFTTFYVFEEIATYEEETWSCMPQRGIDLLLKTMKKSIILIIVLLVDCPGVWHSLALLKPFYWKA